eukprot:scaffold287415_cov31-Tisochrysis_lutea.AAC.1
MHSSPSVGAAFPDAEGPELLTACILVTSHELPVGTVPLALVQRACGTVLIFPPRSVDTAVIRSGSLAADAAVQLRAAKVRPACPLLAREEVASGTVALAGVACSRGRGRRGGWRGTDRAGKRGERGIRGVAARGSQQKSHAARRCGAGRGRGCPRRIMYTCAASPPHVAPKSLLHPGVSTQPAEAAATAGAISRHTKTTNLSPSLSLASSLSSLPFR